MSSLRPRDVRCRVYRPEMRFGLAVTFGGALDSGEYVIAHIDETGDVSWDPEDPSVRIHPTMYFDEGMATALRDALNQDPSLFKSTEAEHLRDAINVRDRLLTMVEAVVMPRVENQIIQDTSQGRMP